jgi:hypothetical protein
MSRSTAPPLAPVRKEVRVPCEPARAFELFTAEMSAWWPMLTHSVGGADHCGVVVEGRVGGQVYEDLPAGRAVWGDVLVWGPPSRFVMTWHPGQDPAAATEVEVWFSPVAEGTRVVLEHRGWERREDAATARESYDTGWEIVLAQYANAG